MSESSLQNLLQTYRVTDWDLILIGDGSGLSATDPCGWAVVLIDRVTGIRRMLMGGQSMGTVTVAELMPYIAALDHFHLAMRGQQHLKPGQPYDLTVHIFTDSQHTAKAGAGKHSRAKHGGLWAAMTYFERQGYRLRWHWLEDGRENPFLLHKLMDEMSAEARARMKDVEQTAELYELLP